MRTILVFALTLASQVAPHIYAQSTDVRAGSHAVFVMTNSVRRNEVIAYSRTKDGLLVERDHYATGGRGSGGTTDPLGSQGSLTLSQDHSLLFAVNAGSGEICVFRVSGAKLDLTQVVSSGGSAPVAVAQHDNLVYVVNFAGNSNVVGFHLDEAGNLIKIHHSIRYLSSANSGPSSIAFSPDGRFLLVTEKLTNNIDTFSVLNDGSISPPKITQNPLPGLFDVVFSPDGAALVVQTGPAGSSNASSISSYLVEEGGTLSPITASVPTLGSAACWVALTPNGEFAFTANSASSTVSAFAIGSSGNITAVAGTVVATLPAGTTDIDTAVSQDAKYLYTLNSGTGTVGIFAVQQDGTLKLTGLASGLEAQHGFNGIAAF
ncbi:MAG: beta-propeller fold lactonase family protein [Acidobacteriota bacterium]|nr:beta-propeller fold lactonase family protein [Acidobacteriota bacterium]